MATTNWIGSRNHLRTAMESSLDNGLSIGSFTNNALYVNRNNADPGFLARYNETNPLVLALMSAGGIKEGAGTTKTGNTSLVETMHAAIGDKLDDFDLAVRAVFRKNTPEYGNIWGKNRNRFYRGSYEHIEEAVKGLSLAMAPYPALNTVAADVLTYYNELVAARTSQLGIISSFKTDSVEIRNAMEALIVQEGRNLSWLNFFFYNKPDPQAEVNAFFPLDKIIDHSHDKLYPHHLGIAAWDGVCRHKFIESDRIKIFVDGTEDVLFYLAPNSKTAPNDKIYRPYRAAAGITIELPAREVFGDSTYRQVMASNTSLANPTHFIFEIIMA